MNEKKPLLTDLAWDVDEPTYRADKALSYSNISTYLELGFNGLDRLFDKKSSPSLTFGSMVDTLLTDGEQAFDARFLVAKMPVLSEQLEKIVKELHTLYSDEYDSLEDIPEGIIASKGEELGYYKDKKYYNTRVKNILASDCCVYYDLLTLSAEKELVSNEDYLAAVECVERLRNDPMTCHYFAADTPNLKHYYQLKFKGMFQNIPIRCMFDLLIVDYVNKVIYPCDLKTASVPENEFFRNFIKWHYWIQAQLYWYILKTLLDAHPEWSGFKLANFRFIVINRNSLKPLVWEYKDTAAEVDLTYGRNHDILCRSWRNILPEMHSYLTESPMYPKYVKKVNDIVDLINNQM